jgi:glycosyltransferase involved in cell wall biosynthesis
MNNRLNICIVSREYPPETLWGGIGTFTYNLAHGLNNIGHKVHVVAFTLGEDSSSDDNGIDIHRISSPKSPFKGKTLWDHVPTALSPFAFFYSHKIQKKIESLHKDKKFDVIDFPEHIGEGFFSIRKKLLPSLVRLYTPLSLIGLLGLQRTTNWFDYYLFGLMEKSSIRRATVVNSPSKALAELVKKEFRVKSEIEIIYNPINTDLFAPKSNIIKQASDVVKVLFVGELTDRKGLHVLARAIPIVTKKVEKVRFTILGNDREGVEGFKSMKEFMLCIFNREGVTGQVEFIGRVPYERLPDIYNGADISVVPSLYDNSPYTCLEALSCGLPVVGTSAGGMPEYIDNGENGLIVPPNNPNALAEALIELSLDAEKRKLYSNNARKKAVSVFKREEVAKKITALYLNAIDLFKMKVMTSQRRAR